MHLQIKKIKRLWEKLICQEASPHQIAIGFSVGLFVSFLPIIPIQTVAALLFAYFLRGNKVACLIGLHIHLMLFPLIPFIFILEYRIGKSLLHISNAPEMKAAVQFTLMHLIHKGWRIWYPLLMGSLIFAIPSTLFYFLVKEAAFRWQNTGKKELLEKSPQPENSGDQKKL